MYTHLRIRKRSCSELHTLCKYAMADRIYAVLHVSPPSNSQPWTHVSLMHRITHGECFGMCETCNYVRFWAGCTSRYCA